MDNRKPKVVFKLNISNLNVAIGLSCSWDYLPVQFFHSWIGMAKPKHSVVFSQRGRADDMRNSIVKQVLGYSDFSHILFLDVDHYHHPETLQKLLSHKKSIVSGLSFRRSEPYDPIMFKKNGSGFDNIESWEDGSLIKVDATGAASLLVDINVFREMKSPWFEMNYPYMGGVAGEDFAFCLKANDLGHDIYVDTSCTNDHIGQIGVNKQTWLNHIKERGEK